MIRRWLLLPLLSLSVMTAPSTMKAASRSQVSPTLITNPAITLGPGYSLPSHDWAYPAFNGESEFPNNGDLLQILGRVTAFQAPFDDLNASDPSVEFTYRFRDLTVVSTGIWDDFVHNRGGIFVGYDLGVLEIFRDDTPDADFASGETFSDGEMLLAATVSELRFVLYTPDFPTQTGNLEFTGGTLFDRVSSDGVPFTATNQGAFDMSADAIPDPIEALGYNGYSQTTINIFPGVAVAPTTWSRIKSLVN